MSTLLVAAIVIMLRSLKGDISKLDDRVMTLSREMSELRGEINSRFGPPGAPGPQQAER